MNTVFIQANNKQILGAKLAKYALEKHRKDPDSFGVEIMNVDEMPLFKEFAGISFKRGNETRVLDPEDLQSFTLSRFMPPELMGHTGRAIVIDPDIFTLTDVTELFNYDMQGNAIAACKRKDDTSGFDSSVMILDCAKLTHWNVRTMLEKLSRGEADYTDISTLRNEKVTDLPRIYNSLDVLTPETKLLHTTGRLTQPWKTGLPIDFTRNDPGKVFGIVPRKLILKLRGKWPSTYQQHPDSKIERFFFDLVRDALTAGATTRSEVESEIDKGNIRKDFLEKI